MQGEGGQVGINHIPLLLYLIFSQHPGVARFEI
jgi:hypothetical protein